MQIFFKRQRQPRWKLKRISFAVKDMSTYSSCVCVCVCARAHACTRVWEKDSKDELRTSRSMLLCMVMIKEEMAWGEPTVRAAPGFKVGGPIATGHWIEKELNTNQTVLEEKAFVNRLIQGQATTKAEDDHGPNHSPSLWQVSESSMTRLTILPTLGITGWE